MAILDIYRSGSIISTVSIDEKTVLVKKLMNADRITASFVSKMVLPVEIGDYIVFGGSNYYLNQWPTFDKQNEQSFKYTANFESVLYDMYNKLLISSDGLNDFSYTGTVNDMVTLIISNMNAIYAGWTVGDVDDSDVKTLDFVNESCRSALNRVSEAFNYEFELIGKTLNFKEAVGTVNDVTFKYGQNQGLYNIVRKGVEDKTLVTKLYAYGSTKNLPYTYRDHAKRLVFEEKYLEKNIGVYGIREKHYTNEDIYPNRTASITNVSAAVDGSSDIYVTDASIDFDINDYLAEGLTAKIVFKSGELSGYEFDIWKFDFDTKQIYFNSIQESDGNVMPNDSFKPQIGDTYTLVDIYMPQSYIITAEANLKAAAQKYLDENCVPKSLYIVKIDPKYAKTSDISIDAGDLVKIVDDQLGIDRAIRVNQISFPIVNKYKMTAVIADFIPYVLEERLIKTNTLTNKLIQNVKNTINNATSTTVINNSSTTVNEGNVNKISINGRDYFWEKAFDNSGTGLEVGDVIYGNYWNRYIFVDRWIYKGGIKELRTSWEESETTDNTP